MCPKPRGMGVIGSWLLLLLGERSWKSSQGLAEAASSPPTSCSLLGCASGICSARCRHQIGDGRRAARLPFTYQMDGSRRSSCGLQLLRLDLRRSITRPFATRVRRVGDDGARGHPMHKQGKGAGLVWPTAVDHGGLFRPSWWSSWWRANEGRFACGRAYVALGVNGMTAIAVGQRLAAQVLISGIGPVLATSHDEITASPASTWVGSCQRHHSSGDDRRSRCPRFLLAMEKIERHDLSMTKFGQGRVMTGSSSFVTSG